MALRRQRFGFGRHRSGASSSASPLSRCSSASNQRSPVRRRVASASSSSCKRLVELLELRRSASASRPRKYGHLDAASGPLRGEAPAHLGDPSSARHLSATRPAVKIVARRRPVAKPLLRGQCDQRRGALLDDRPLAADLVERSSAEHSARLCGVAELVRSSASASSAAHQRPVGIAQAAAIAPSHKAAGATRRESWPP